MRFAKMQGAGNDFVLVQAEGEERDWPELAQAVCDRHFGVGADGLILVMPSRMADVRMRMFNPDGSEAEMCGNGVRCLAKYAAERGLAQPQDGRIAIETLPGVLTAELFGAEGLIERVRASMGQPRFAAAEIPLLLPEADSPLARAEAEAPVKDYPLEVEGQRLPVTCLSLGNPHAVHFYAQPIGRFPLEVLGPKVENHPLFPNRVNLEVVRIVGRDALVVRVWERGAGATLACGSGACAAMVAAHLHRLVDERVEVRLPGGKLTVEWGGEGEVYLTGAAELVFEGEWKIV